MLGSVYAGQCVRKANYSSIYRFHSASQLSEINAGFPRIANLFANDDKNNIDSTFHVLFANYDAMIYLIDIAAFYKKLIKRQPHAAPVVLNITFTVMAFWDHSRLSLASSVLSIRVENGSSLFSNLRYYKHHQY